MDLTPCPVGIHLDLRRMDDCPAAEAEPALEGIRDAAGPQHARASMLRPDVAASRARE